MVRQNGFRGSKYVGGAAHMPISSVYRGYDLKQYRKWVKAHDMKNERRQAIREKIRQMPWFPTFSFILLPPTFGVVTPNVTINSVQHQLYAHWELWLPSYMPIASTESRLRRIPIDDGPGISPATLFNTALAAAEGEFVLPLTSDVTIPEGALYELATAIGRQPTADVLYTDEDHLDSDGNRCMPHFKTAWDPDRILGSDAIGLLVVYRKEHLTQLGGAQTAFSSIALTLYDLALRAGFATSAGRIRHIPAILCHRLLNSTEASLGLDAEARREIVRQHLTKRGIRADVEPAPLVPRWNRIIREVPDPAPLVSVIVPTRDRADLLERCTNALLTRTDYPELELLVIDNDSREPKLVELLEHLSLHSRVKVLSYPGSFNYSAMNNIAAREARGEILLLLNNDIDTIHSDWLWELVSHAVRPDVGAVGAKLLYPNGQVQHAGIVLGPGPTLNHQFRFAERSDIGPCGELVLTRTVSAVTGACLALRRRVFLEVGGLDVNLAVSLNDVDLCFRIGDHGYRIVWTPFAQLFHLESASRGYDTTPEKQALAAKEHRYFSRFWEALLDVDPFRNPNLVYGWDTTSLSPPR
jgi:GT2 family glycosyltransferase